MAFTLTSATDVDDLLDKLYTFATVTDGAWTGVFNEDLGQRQIGIEVSNCHIALGSIAAEIGIDHLVPFVVFHPQHQVVPRDAGVIDQNSRLTEVLLNMLQGGGN